MSSLYSKVVSTLTLGFLVFSSTILNIKSYATEAELLENNKVYNFTSLDSNSNLALEASNVKNNDTAVYVKTLDTSNPNQIRTPDFPIKSNST